METKDMVLLVMSHLTKLSNGNGGEAELSLAELSSIDQKMGGALPCLAPQMISGEYTTSCLLVQSSMYF